MISFEYDVYPHSANSLGVMSTLSDVIDHEAIQMTDRGEYKILQNTYLEYSDR